MHDPASSILCFSGAAVAFSRKVWRCLIQAAMVALIHEAQLFTINTVRLSNYHRKRM